MLARIEAAAGPQPNGGPGRPPYDPGSVLLADLLRVYLNLTYRDIEMLLIARSSCVDGSSSRVR